MGLGKGSTPEMILKAGAAAKQAGLPIETYFILGHPNETAVSMKRTIDLAVRLNPETPIFGVMLPFPGTEIGRMAAAGEGGYRLRSTNWDDYDKQIGGALEFADLTRNEIERLQLWAYTKVFLRNGRYIDFVKFCWRYRTAGWSLVTKILRIRSDKLATAESGHVSSNPPPALAEIEASTRAWQSWQKTDLARIKKLRPGQSNVVFIEAQRKRPEPVPAPDRP